MKTRTLLLMALGCGLAIMLAGAVFLFQLTTQDDVAEPTPLGDDVDVGDMSVLVRGSDEEGGTLTVSVQIGGTVDDAPSDDFRLIASGRPVTPIESAGDCAATDGDLQTCTVTFDVSTADGESRVLFYERGDDQARWVLG